MALVLVLMAEVVGLQLLVVEIIAKPRMLYHQTMDETRWVEKQPHRCQGLVKAPMESPGGPGHRVYHPCINKELISARWRLISVVCRSNLAETQKG